MRLLLDSGISTLFLFRRSSDFELSQDESRPFVARTELGSRAVRQNRLRSFSIGKDRFSDLPVILIESQNAVSPQIEDRVEDGLLPTSLFRKIYFNHQKGYVIFNPS
jgi:hypothetical protein